MAAFVRSGDPSGPLGEWPTFTPDKRLTQILDATSHVELNRLAARLDFWAQNRDNSAPALSTIDRGDAHED
jgi:para-nitrobenzyl esterase